MHLTPTLVGPPIPAWYDDAGKAYVGHSEDDVREKYNLGDIALSQDEDVLDTWFSSALWTFGTQGWPEQTERLKGLPPYRCAGHRFRHYFLLGRAHDHDEHAPDQR